MLTPGFSIQQEDSCLVLQIHAPYIKASDVEIYIEGSFFKFFCKPYFLRLSFPREVVENGKEKAKYDVDSGTFTIHIPKKVPGEYFPDLNFLTSLLATKKSAASGQPLIEVLDSDSANEKPYADGDCCNDVVVEEDEDWEIEQEFYDEKLTLHGHGYGFANKVSGVFSRFEDMLDVVEVRDPDGSSPAQRRALRTAAEDKKFDPQHYLADLYEHDIVDELLKYKSLWNTEYDSVMKRYKETVYAEVTELVNLRGSTQIFHEEQQVIFTEDERSQMIRLPKKDYLLSDADEHSLYLGLLDILLAYCYNHRITEGENNSETSWNIAKISSTLSCFETFTNMADVLCASYRRMLCFPLHRSWALCEAVCEDVLHILLLGRQWILRCLLDCYRILQHDHPYYVLADLYVRDFCIWIQTSSKKKVKSLANSLQSVKIRKADVGFDLEALEQAAQLVSSEDGISGQTCVVAKNHRSANQSGSESDSGTSTDLCSDTSEELSTDSDDDVAVEGPSAISSAASTIRTGTEELLSVMKSCLIEELESVDNSQES